MEARNIPAYTLPDPLREANSQPGAHFLVLRKTNKERVMKLKIFSAAMVLALVAGPAMARNVNSNQGHSGKSLYCATIEPGNPFSRFYDYIAWSKWRQRGGWDSRGDDACFFNPHYQPPGYGPQHF